MLTWKARCSCSEGDLAYFVQAQRPFQDDFRASLGCFKKIKRCVCLIHPFPPAHPNKPTLFPSGAELKRVSCRRRRHPPASPPSVLSSSPARSLICSASVQRSWDWLCLAQSRILFLWPENVKSHLHSSATHPCQEHGAGGFQSSHPFGAYHLGVLLSSRAVPLSPPPPLCVFLVEGV